MVSTEYEKDGERRTGYIISKGFDISQMSGKPLEERPQPVSYTHLDVYKRQMGMCAVKRAV